LSTKTKQLAAALAGRPLPKTWWKTVEWDYYLDWLSWGIVVEVSRRRNFRSPLGGRRGFMFQIGPWGMAFRWPKESLSAEMATGQEAGMVGGVNMAEAGFKTSPPGMTPMQAALSARTRGSNKL
jgi:hypothetical protein